MSKLCQNLPTNTPNASHLALIGWQTIDSKVAIMKLIFLWRILCLPIDNVYRRVVMYCLHLCLYEGNYVNLRSPTYSMFTYVTRYNLTDTLVNCMQSHNQGKINRYKKIIKNVVKDHERMCWKATMLMFHKLPLYDSCVTDIQMHPWWHFAKSTPSYFRQASSIVAIICGAQPKFFQCNFNSSLCGLCCERQLETPEHILFKCTAFEILRSKNLSQIRLAMPFAMRREFTDMTVSSKYYFILSAFNSEYCVEWNSIYKSISVFVYEIYKQRKVMYDTRMMDLN